MIENKYIVVVKDDLEHLEAVKSILSDNEYRIKCFKDGAMAWDFLSQNHEDVCVIILAKTLPNIAGMELLSKIQEHESLCKVPVIIQTVDSGEGKYKNAIELGAQFYIEKPIDERELLRLVKASVRSFNKIVDDFNENKSHIEKVSSNDAVNSES